MTDPVVFTGVKAHSRQGSQWTGFINPAIAAKAFVEKTGAPMDPDSFDRVAEQCGDSTPEQLAKGFLIDNYGALQRLCELGNFVIFTHRDTGLVTARHADDGGCLKR